MGLGYEVHTEAQTGPLNPCFKNMQLKRKYSDFLNTAPASGCCDTESVSQTWFDTK